MDRGKELNEKSNSELLQNWEVLKGVDEKQKEQIRFFHAFQTYTGDDVKRSSSAFYITSNDEVFAVGHNNRDNLLALTGNDFAKNVELEEPRKIDELSGKNIRKIVVSERYGTALTEDGKFLYWGTAMKALQYEANDRKYVELPHEPRENFKILDMACGAHSITFVTDENQVLVWGCINLYYSEFYNFENVPLRKKIRVTGLATGWYHTALLDQMGQVWTFGYGSVGQLGYKSQDSDYLTPRKVTLKKPCIKVECGAYSSLFLLNNGELYACGSNSPSDHLCVGKTGYVISPTKVLLDENVSDIAATYAWASGRWQSLFSAVSQDGKKYFKWGQNTKSDKPEVSDSDESFLEIFANFKTPQSLGELIRVDVIELVGSDDKNTSNLLPDKGEIANSLASRSILDEWLIFDVLDDDFKRDISHFTVFTVPSNRIEYGAFVVTKTDDVYSWGANSRNIELGYKTDEVATKSPGKVENLSGKGIKKILMSLRGGVGISTSGLLYTWGANNLPEAENLEGRKATDVACGLTFYVYLLDNSKVYLNGKISSDFEEEEHTKIVIPGNENPIGLAAGAWHFLVLTDASNVFAYGDGRYTQLGSSKWKKNEKSPLRGVKINSSPCKKIMCGTSSSFFLTDDGEVFACGINNINEPLGVGKGKEVNKPERVLIDEKIEDLAAAKETNSSGGFFSSFAFKTESGKIYKSERDNTKPALDVEATSLIDAFKGKVIPESLSLVRLSLTTATTPDTDDENEIHSNLDGPLVSRESSAKNLYADPLYSDVTIKLRDGVIPGHKVLLHTESAFFRNALSSNDVVNRDELDFVSYNPKAVRALLKYVEFQLHGH